MPRPYTDPFHPTTADLAVRAPLFGLSPADERNLDDVRFVVREHTASILRALADYLLGVDSLREHLEDGHTLEQLSKLHRDYVATLGLDLGAEDYAEHRARFAAEHQHAGVDQRTCLGLYSKLFELVARRLTQRHAHDATRLGGLLISLERVLAYDAHFAVESYTHADRVRHEKLAASLTAEQKKVAVARRDSVTHIDVRAFLVDLLRKELARSRRFSHPFSLLFIDIDHFKHVNDTHGHATGDAVLREVAETIRDAVRPEDIVGRYGGDEFVVGLVHADEMLARAIAERIRVGVAAACAGDDGAPVTVSIGCASRGGPDEQLDELLRRADDAMYAAKAGGRNRVMTPPAVPHAHGPTAGHN